VTVRGPESGPCTRPRSPDALTRRARALPPASRHPCPGGYSPAWPRTKLLQHPMGGTAQPPGRWWGGRSKDWAQAPHRMGANSSTERATPDDWDQALGLGQHDPLEGGLAPQFGDQSGVGPVQRFSARRPGSCCRAVSCTVGSWRGDSNPQPAVYKTAADRPPRTGPCGPCCSGRVGRPANALLTGRVAPGGMTNGMTGAAVLPCSRRHVRGWQSSA
jgi:hypothetical protein